MSSNPNAEDIVCGFRIHTLYKEKESGEMRMKMKVGYAEDVVEELHGDEIEEGGYYTYYYACC